MALDDATWEDATFLNSTFPGHKLFHLEDKVQLMAAALSGPEPRLNYLKISTPDKKKKKIQTRND